VICLEFNVCVHHEDLEITVAIVANSATLLGIFGILLAAGRLA
jgi:hypothetical protein